MNTHAPPEPGGVETEAPRDNEDEEDGAPVDDEAVVTARRDVMRVRREVRENKEANEKKP